MSPDDVLSALNREARRVLPGFLLVAANLAAFVGAATAFVAGAVPVSHHWLIPFHEFLLLAQAWLLPRPPAVALTGLSLLVLGVAAARLETIWLSHHLIHFSMAYALAAPLHGMLAARVESPAWRAMQRRYAWGFLAVAAAAAAFAWRQGIWWGLRDGG
jgi:hypothetical protein